MYAAWCWLNASLCSPHIFLYGTDDRPNLISLAYTGWSFYLDPLEWRAYLMPGRIIFLYTMCSIESPIISFFSKNICTFPTFSSECRISALLYIWKKITHPLAKDYERTRWYMSLAARYVRSKTMFHYRPWIYICVHTHTYLQETVRGCEKKEKEEEKEVKDWKQ